MYPILFESAYFTIHSLWLFVALALIVGTFSFIALGLKNGLKLQFLSENAFKILVFAMIGSRLIAIISNWSNFFYEYSSTTFLQIFKIWDKGFSLWGGVVIGIVTLYYVCKKNEQDFYKWLDSLFPAFLIGIAVSAIGLFLDGSIYGNETSLPWGFNFESPAIKYTVPIHPTQIYILLFSVTLAVTLILVRHNKFFEKSGNLAIFGTSAFALFFFLQEFLRGDDVTEIFGIRVSMIIAALAFISSLIFGLLRLKSEGQNQKHVTK